LFVVSVLFVRPCWSALVLSLTAPAPSAQSAAVALSTAEACRAPLGRGEHALNQSVIAAASKRVRRRYTQDLNVSLSWADRRINLACPDVFRLLMPVGTWSGCRQVAIFQAGGYLHDLWQSGPTLGCFVAIRQRPLPVATRSEHFCSFTVGVAAPV
jgi:hypothetical protein